MKLPYGSLDDRGKPLSLTFLLSVVSVLSLLAPVRSQVTQQFDPYSAAARCPFPCDNDRSGWARYQNLSQLSNCNRTVLLDLNLYNDVDDSELRPIRACAVENSQLKRRQVFSFDSDSKASISTFDVQEQTTDIQVLWGVGGSESSTIESTVSAAGVALADHLPSETNGQTTILFAKTGHVIFGLYAGRQIEKQSLATVVKEVTDKITANINGKAQQAAVQLCDSKSLNTQILGIFLDTTGDIAAVQSALRGWNDAECVDGQWEEGEKLQDVTISMIPGNELTVGPDKNDGESLAKRETCRYTQAAAGDGCWALADRCKITQEELIEYNDPDLCEALVVGQYVCCSPGELPDFSPQPNPDGTCKTHTIQSGDLCDTIARENSMTVDDINERNKNTWGWMGCSYLVVGNVICLSTGSPPMPAPIANAVCGPQVPGTERPDDMSDLADMNPCPLNACCNVWGQCGITEEFCIPSPADTGAPGTAKPGSNGCIASCGLDIVNNDEPPGSFMRVGYFEAWNSDRPCLHMRPHHIDTNHYTHIHFAFGGITEGFDVDMSELHSTYEEFKAITGVKKILSFGGWSFSTEHDTFPIFREGVTPEQRQLFADNVVKFIEDEGLDGVDFDWEYPGAPDIPGIPPGSEQDGPNYLAFLKLVREALPAEKTVGIAAPASFWYLKGFPIKEIGEVVDYIIYMTYDLHGQWDYGNQYATEGCHGGDCLRSHVNRTETEYSLAMVTKAGVPANKLIIGMAMYGRSFEMVEEGCYGPDCKYTGPESGAAPGRCTGVQGYVSNFEIREIIAGGDVQEYSDEDGDILVYDGIQWVSWLSKGKYKERVDWITGLNFGGTSDWAIDLDADYGDNDGPGGGDPGSGPTYISPDIYESDDPVISCYPPCTLVFPPWVLSTPTTISMPPVTLTFEENWETTVTISDEIITTSAASITSTVITVPPVTTTEIELWNVVWTGEDTDDGEDANVIWLTSSVTLPPMTLTQTVSDGITRPPITWTYRPGPYPTPTKIPKDPEDPDNPDDPEDPDDPDDPDNPDDPDPGPPPPPPPGFPPSVTISSGPPKPTCKPDQKCGGGCRSNCNPFDSGCIGICGCIGPFCPRGNCVGPGCSAGGGGDGGGDPDDPPSSCRTSTTVSFCQVDCSVQNYPGTTSTWCDDPECSHTITACTATGSTTTTTTTMSCEPEATYDNLPPSEQVPIIGDGGRGGWVVDPGEFTQRPTTTTTTEDPEPTTSELPIPTGSPPEGGPYCFRDHNEDGRWQSFTDDEGNDLLNILCYDIAEELPPSNTFGHAVRSPNGILASVTWADEQGGCQPKSPLPLGDYCADTFRYIIYSCDDFDREESYGGAFVDNAEYGCVRWWLGKDSLSTLIESTSLERPEQLSREEQSVVMDMLAHLEPELPRVDAGEIEDFRPSRGS